MENNYLKDYEMESVARALSSCETAECRNEVFEEAKQQSLNNLAEAVAGCPIGGGTKGSSCNAEGLQQGAAVVNYQQGKYDTGIPEVDVIMQTLHMTNLEQQLVLGSLAAGATGEEIARTLGLSGEAATAAAVVFSNAAVLVGKKRVAATQTGGGVAPVVHGNSKASTKEQHLYMIQDADANIKKIGVSGQILNKDGSSPRANSQLKDGDTATVLESGIPGRSNVLQKEGQVVEGLRKAGHELPDQKRPKI